MTDKTTKYVFVNCLRKTFDDNIDTQVAERLRECLPEGTKLTLKIGCDICKSLFDPNERVKILRQKCDKCDFYYDFCVEHPQPDKCPLCLQNKY
jgi:hypothetical protein